jgi:hypothetical protein
MLFSLRTWLFAITVLLVAEDFQYLLKIGSNHILEQKASYHGDGCKDCDEEDSESKSEKEKEEEKKEKDENTNDDPDALLNDFSRRTKNIIRATLRSPSDIAHELESPPPEF